MTRGIVLTRPFRNAEASAQTSICHLFLILLLTFQWVSLSAQTQTYDRIIFRNGEEVDARINFVNKTSTSYISSSGPQRTENKDIYMIKYAQRDPVFFTHEGEMFSATFHRGKIPKNAVIVYLMEGGEIVCYNFFTSGDEIFFNYSRTTGAGQPRERMPKKDIFMIRYPDGTRDILNEFEFSEDNTSKTDDELENSIPESVRENPVAESQSASRPKSTQGEVRIADIKLKNGVNIPNAHIFQEDANRIKYKKDARPSSQMFSQKWEDIANIIYH